MTLSKKHKKHKIALTSIPKMYAKKAYPQQHSKEIVTGKALILREISQKLMAIMPTITSFNCDEDSLRLRLSYNDIIEIYINYDDNKIAVGLEYDRLEDSNKGAEVGLEDPDCIDKVVSVCIDAFKEFCDDRIEYYTNIKDYFNERD